MEISIETLKSLVEVLNNASPTVLVLIAVILGGWLMSKKGTFRRIADNHLKHIEANIGEIKVSQDKHLELTQEIRDGILKLVDRSNRGDL